MAWGGAVDDRQTNVCCGLVLTVGGLEMKNEEQGSLRTDESSRLGRDGAGWLWGLERLAANTRYRRGGGGGR